MNQYTNQAQQRILRVLRVLAGNEFNGLTPGDIARSLKISPSAVTRDLANLETAGLAERLPNHSERWRLSPKLVQIAIAFQEELARSERSLQEVQQRYGRLPA